MIKNLLSWIQYTIFRTVQDDTFNLRISAPKMRLRCDIQCTSCGAPAANGFRCEYCGRTNTIIAKGFTLPNFIPTGMYSVTDFTEKKKAEFDQALIQAYGIGDMRTPIPPQTQQTK